jgi:hypothetical protein
MFGILNWLRNFAQLSQNLVNFLWFWGWITCAILYIHIVDNYSLNIIGIITAKLAKIKIKMRWVIIITEITILRRKWGFQDQAWKENEEESFESSSISSHTVDMLLKFCSSTIVSWRLFHDLKMHPERHTVHTYMHTYILT